jgi:hypothetical protein
MLVSCRYFQVPRRLIDLAEEQLQLHGAAAVSATAWGCGLHRGAESERLATHGSVSAISTAVGFGSLLSTAMY